MSRPRKLGDILCAAPGSEVLHERLAQIRVLREWGEVVGPRIAKVTRAGSFQNGTLTVGVRGAVWKSEIEYLKSQIVATINERLGKDLVTGIRLTSGYAPEKGSKKELEPAPGIPKDDGIRLSPGQKRRIAHAVLAVTDTKLRDSIAGAWESKKRLDERKRRAGWRACRSCGQYEPRRAGLCPACAVDISIPSGPTAGGYLNGEGK